MHKVCSFPNLEKMCIYINFLVILVIWGGISSTEHLKVMVLKRFSKFNDKLLSSNNPLIKNLYRLQCGDMRSSLGRNIHELAVNTSYRSNIPIHPVPPGEEWRVQLVRELLAVRDDVVTVDGLMPREIEVILQRVCCD